LLDLSKNNAKMPKGKAKTFAGLIKALHPKKRPE